MLPVKKKTIEVSYVETKPYTIKIPSFVIPVHYLKISSCIALGLGILGLSTSFSPTIIKPEFTKETAFATVINVGKSEEIEEKEEVEEQEDKVIPITDIIPNTKANQKVLNFICTNEVLSRAFKVQQETGLKVATIVSQKGVESAWDNSSLCKKTKNYGNIKCFKKHNHTNAGCVRAYDKIEGSNDWYVKLNSNWEGWNFYKDLIYRRYMKAANQEEIKEQIVWLKKKRYATDKNYVGTLWSVVNKYHLIKLQEYIDKGFTITSETGKYTFLKQ